MKRLTRLQEVALIHLGLEALHDGVELLRAEAQPEARPVPTATPAPELARAPLPATGWRKINEGVKPAGGSPFVKLPKGWPKTKAKKATKRVAWNKGRKGKKWTPAQRAKFIRTMKRKRKG